MTPRKSIIDSFVDRSGAGLVQLEKAASVEQTIDASVKLLGVALMALREFERSSPDTDLSVPSSTAIPA